MICNKVEGREIDDYTKYSRVLGISNIDFTPAEMTATGVLPSSVRSEDISIAAKSN